MKSLICLSLLLSLANCMPKINDGIVYEKKVVPEWYYPTEYGFILYPTEYRICISKETSHDVLTGCFHVPKEKFGSIKLGDHFTYE